MPPSILFVDDEPLVTSSIQRALLDRPYRVLTALSGEEALGILEREAVDVVVSDERMPGISGAEFLTEVRQRHPEVVRVMMTGYSSLDSMSRAINEAAVFRFLQKPCSFSRLLEVLDEALLARRVDEPTAAVPVLEVEEAIRTLSMAFQPIVSVRERSVWAYEALLRPTHPSWPSPVALIAASEQTGRVLALERAIHERVLAAAEWLPKDAQIFVNVHPDSLAAPRLLLEGPLRLLKDRVCLEISERASVMDSATQLRVVRDLREFGYRIAVDDLGAGYANLGNLVRLAPEVVKIDIELVRGVDHNSRQSDVVASVVRIGEAWGMAVVCEGVESAAERDHLLGLGCFLHQGFLFARPAVSLQPVRW